MSMTKQKIFTVVAKHLLGQKSRSESPGGDFCMYRGTEGRKCAVGVLIKDEFYTADLEDTQVTNNLVLAALEYSGVLDSSRYSRGDKKELEKLELLQALQQMHDRIPPSDWYSNLIHVANQFNLKMSKVVLPQMPVFKF